MLHSSHLLLTWLLHSLLLTIHTHGSSILILLLLLLLSSQQLSSLLLGQHSILHHVTATSSRRWRTHLTSSCRCIVSHLLLSKLCRLLL